MKRFGKCICILLALVVMLTGCDSFSQYLKNIASMAGIHTDTSFAEMTYTRPDVDSLLQVLEDSCSTAMEAEDLGDVINGIYAYYDAYDEFSTAYSLAYIHYCQDVTDSYWSGEYEFCEANYYRLDAGLEELYYTLADSPHREALEGEDYFGAGYFDAYEGESIWDEEFMALMDEESRLLNLYYDLYEQALEAEYYSEEYFSVYGSQMAQVYVDLVAQRQKIASCAGYDSYPQFAYDFYYYRRYTPQQAEEYMLSLSEALSELYRQVNNADIWTVYDRYCSETATYDYGRQTAKAMGGDIWEAFQVMDNNGLYDISFGENKFDSSFEIYLSKYSMPFLFLCPALDPSDQLTFIHEFGHYVNDYLCWGSYAGTDVAEVHSQAMEYLSLCYGPAEEDLVTLKMADCLMSYIEQSAYALFEHQVYSLTGEQLTVQNVQALYEQIGLQFGFDSWGWDCRDYVMVEHFFSSPMYIISYVASNDVAFQIYQKELEHSGEGLAVYEECLYSEESDILYFAETYGLDSPFAEGRIEKITALLEKLLSGI